MTGPHLLLTHALAAVAKLLLCAVLYTACWAGYVCTLLPLPHAWMRWLVYHCGDVALWATDRWVRYATVAERSEALRMLRRLMFGAGARR